MTGGFSEEPGSLTVGHFLGLRWFHVDLNSNNACGEFTVTRDQPPITLDMTDPWRIEVPATITLRCSCGASARSGLEQFRQDHNPYHRPTLSGVWGNWRPGENVATCAKTALFAHPVPGPECGCGFWAYWALGSKRVSDPAVPAIVKGYGDYIKGDLGFRVSHAKIEALLVPGDGESFLVIANAIEAAYGVPVYSSMHVMLSQHQAPEGQPPLRDDYYGKRQDLGGQGSRWSWSPNANRITNASRMAAALKSGALPCLSCGTPACSAGQGQCASCQAGVTQVSGSGYSSGGGGSKIQWATEYLKNTYGS